MLQDLALGSRYQLGLFCFRLWVFGTSNTMTLLGWIRVFTGRLSNLRPRIFLPVSWVNGRPDWSAVESSRTQSTAPSSSANTCFGAPLLTARKNLPFSSLRFAAIS